MIRQCFKNKKSLFIPFIMAGHPTVKESIAAMIGLSESRADIIEIGVPFSDPVADGPINQRAAQRALKQGVSLGRVFEMVRQVRTRGCDTPIIIFSYFNPILAFGLEQFAIQAKQAGVNGVLIVDLPPEEGLDFYPQLKQFGLDFVLLISKTTDPKRFDLYKQLDPSFIYYISRLSVTGVQQVLDPDLEKQLECLRAHFLNINIAVGFGISNCEQAMRVSTWANGVIIGSVLVKTLEEQGLDAFKKLASELGHVIHHCVRTI